MLTGGAALLGLSAFAAPLRLNAKDQDMGGSPIGEGDANEYDQWFGKLKGSHRVVYDAPQPHAVFPSHGPEFPHDQRTDRLSGQRLWRGGGATPRCHLLCLPGPDVGEVRLRGSLPCQGPWPRIPSGRCGYGDPDAQPFWNTKPGDFKVPGIGVVDIGIKELQASGVMFCVCSAAMTVYSTAIAGGMGLKPEDVMAEWKANLIPDIQMVPSGVWALGRAQELKCAYIFAG